MDLGPPLEAPAQLYFRDTTFERNGVDPLGSFPTSIPEGGAVTIFGSRNFFSDVRMFRTNFLGNFGSLGSGLHLIAMPGATDVGDVQLTQTSFLRNSSPDPSPYSWDGYALCSNNAWAWRMLLTNVDMGMGTTDNRDGDICNCPGINYRRHVSGPVVPDLQVCP